MYNYVVTSTPEGATYEGGWDEPHATPDQIARNILAMIYGSTEMLVFHVVTTNTADDENALMSIVSRGSSLSHYYAFRYQHDAYGTLVVVKL